MLSILTLLTFALLSFSYATLTPDDIEPGWLTLATTDGQLPQSPQSTHTGQLPEQSNLYVSQTLPHTLPDANPLSRQTTKYSKSARTRARISQSWTKERRQMHAERMRLVSTGRKHTAQAKEKMRINHRTRKNYNQKPSTIQKISDSMKKHHARKKQDK